MKKSSLKAYSAPFFVLNIIFVIIPLLIIVFFAFTRTTDGKFSITFDNFINFFQNKTYVLALGRSLLVAFISSLICLVVAYPIALVLSNSKLKKSAVLLLMFILPMWINSLLRILALRNVLIMMHVPDGYGAIVIGLVYDFFPFMLIPIYNILSNIDKYYIEASADLGASPVVTFLKVKLPLSVPGIVSGMLMVFTPAISSFAIHEMLGGTDGFMLGGLINSQFTAESSEWHQGSAMAIIMLVIVVATMMLSSVASRGKTKAEDRLL